MTDDPRTDGGTLEPLLARMLIQGDALRTDVHAAERARRIAAAINLGLLGLLVVLVALFGVVMLQVSQTNERVADCTTPGGRCYEDGRARTGSAVADLIRAEVAVAECARQWPGESGPAFDRKLEACVAERLQRAREIPAPSVTPTR